MPAIMMQAAQMMQFLSDLDRRGMLSKDDRPIDINELPTIPQEVNQ